MALGEFLVSSPNASLVESKPSSVRSANSYRETRRGPEQQSKYREMFPMSSAIRGTFSPEPRLSVAAIRCDNTVVPEARTAVAKLSLKDFSSHVLVPVQRKTFSTNLHQEIAPDWDRYLFTTYGLGPPTFSTPILLSPRNRWFLNDQTVEIFDRAVVIDGAKRLEAAFQFRSPQEIPVTIVLGLNSDAELALRRKTLSNTLRTQVETRERFGTTAPRLVLEHVYVDFEIQSDPFVVPTSRGYSPTILVRRSNVPYSEHILIGARSLATELETLRCKHGSLIGLHVSARKTSPKKISPYVVRVNEKEGG